MVGNPPYGDILDNNTKNYLEALGFPKTGGRAEVYADFITTGLRQVALRRDFTFIIPNTLIDGAQFTGLREFVSSQSTVKKIRDYRDLSVFGDANVQTMVIRCRKQIPESLYDVDYEYWNVKISQLVSEGLHIKAQSEEPWHIQTSITKRVNLPGLCIPLEPGIGTCHDAGVDYKWKGVGWQNRGKKVSLSDLLLYDGDKRHMRDYPLLKGIDIDRYSLSFNKNWLIHDFKKYKSKEAVVQVYLDLALVPDKILTRQTSDRIQACIDNSQYVTSKSIHTTIVRDENYSSGYVVSILNSKLMSHIYQTRTGESGRLFAQVKLYDLRQLPIPRIDFTTPAEERQQQVAKAINNYQLAISNEQSPIPNLQSSLLQFTAERLNANQTDVIHDLLAYLAGQMIEMHQEKQRLTENFWLDLEGLTEESTFKKLRGKGKQEATLAKQAACAPFVNPNSRSSRNLDESLAWNEEAFKAFVRLLASKVKGLAAITTVYRDHAPAYAQLVHRIHATDGLIDQLVYQLYGLTEDEIAIVEGN